MSPGHVAPLQAVLVDRPILWRVVAVVAGSWILAVSSWISAPMYPVPMTMQSFIVLAFAGLLSDRLSTPLLQRALGGAASSYEL